MELFNMLGQASIMARVSLLVTLFPLAAGLAYLVRPTEQRLALMRPISLAGIFSGLGGAVLGLMNVLRWYGIDNPPPSPQNMAIGAAESLVTPVRGVRMPHGCVALRRAGDATESIVKGSRMRAEVIQRARSRTFCANAWRGILASSPSGTPSSVGNQLDTVLSAM